MSDSYSKEWQRLLRPENIAEWRKSVGQRKEQCKKCGCNTENEEDRYCGWCAAIVAYTKTL